MQKFQDLLPQRKTPWITTAKREYRKQQEKTHPKQSEKTEAQILEERKERCKGRIETLPLAIQNITQVLQREITQLESIEQDDIVLTQKKRTGEKNRRGHYIVKTGELTPEQLEDSLRRYGDLEAKARDRISQYRMEKLNLEQQLKTAQQEYRRVRQRQTELDSSISLMAIEEISGDDLPEYESEPTLPPVKTVKRGRMRAKGKRPPSKSPPRRPSKKLATYSESCTPPYQPKKDDEEEGPPTLNIYNYRRTDNINLYNIKWTERNDTTENTRWKKGFKQHNEPSITRRRLTRTHIRR